MKDSTKNWVEGISSTVQAIGLIVLVIVTIGYASSTKNMSEVMKNQSTIMIEQVDIMNKQYQILNDQLEIDSPYLVIEDLEIKNIGTSEDYSLDIKVKNKGKKEAQLINVTVRFFATDISIYNNYRFHNKIIIPRKEYIIGFTLFNTMEEDFIEMIQSAKENRTTKLMVVRINYEEPNLKKEHCIEPLVFYDFPHDSFYMEHRSC